MSLNNLNMVNASSINPREEGISDIPLKLSHIGCDELVPLVIDDAFQ
jgi:hypothetical protein